MKIYAKVTKGPLHTIFSKFSADETKARQAWQQWGDPIGVTGVRGHVCTFRDAPPAGWRKSPKVEGGYTPDNRTKAGKEFKSQMMKLPCIPGGAQMVLGYLSIRGKNVMMINQTGTPALRQINKTTFLTAIDDYWLPKDRAGIKEITASEFTTLWAKRK